MPPKKKPRGRPPKAMPPPIEASSPEEIAEVVLRFTPPAKREDWQYMKDWRARIEAQRNGENGEHCI